MRDKKDSCIHWTEKGCEYDNYTQWNQLMQGKITNSQCPPNCYRYEAIKKGIIDIWLKHYA